MGDGKVVGYGDGNGEGYSDGMDEGKRVGTAEGKRVGFLVVGTAVMTVNFNLTWVEEVTVETEGK